MSQLKRKLRNIAEVRWSWSWTFGQCSHKHATFSTETQHLSDGPRHLIAKRTQHLACIENLGLRCLKNRLNGNSKFRYSKLLNDWSDACPEVIVDRRWLDEVVRSQIDRFDGHCLDGRWLDDRWMAAGWMAARLKTAPWSRVRHWTLRREVVVTVAPVRWEHQSAFRNRSSSNSNVSHHRDSQRTQGPRVCFEFVSQRKLSACSNQ